MDLKTFIEETDPEVLQKLASEAQDELVEKVANRLIEVMFPLFEKTAEYTAHLLLEKIAEGEKEEAPKEEKKEGQEEVGEAVQQTQQAADATVAVNKELHDAPTAANKTNEAVDPSVTPGGLKAQQVKDALSEAIEVGQPDKILPFVKALAGQYPESVTEVIKMVKIQLHDGIMKKQIDQETAISITDQLNAMVDGGLQQ